MSAEGQTSDVVYTTSCAAILLTGGASRRMGFDKTSLMVGGTPLAVRLGAMLAQICAPAIEIGTGRSGLPSMQERPGGEGPLVAIAAGVRALAARGSRGPALVLACDLPMVTAALLRALAEWPGSGSVVPDVDGHPQPLCARWSRRRPRCCVAAGRTRNALASGFSRRRSEPPVERARMGQGRRA